MKKDAKVFISHILESIELAEEYVRGKTLSDFTKSKKLQDSVIRRLEIMGEAVKNLPKDFTVKHSEIPWKEIAGMRDILIHEYFGVDLEMTWNVVEENLPDLKKKLLAIKHKK